MNIYQISGDNNNVKIFDFLPKDKAWIEVKHFRHNRKNELYEYRERTKEYYIVLDGVLWVNGNEYSAGTILSYAPMERRNFFVIKDVTCISIKDPVLSTNDELKEGQLSLDTFTAPYKQSVVNNGQRYSDIDYRDISVVIQGAIDSKYTPMSIESIRKYLPGSTIIISTWPSESADSLDYDRIIINNDPGAPYFVKPNGLRHYDNRNRLLVSTQGGIEAVTTKYTLKMRSDCILFGDGIVRNYGKYPLKTNEYSIFKNKLVVGEQCNIMKLYFETCFRPYVFHVSDWFCFGLTEDVKAFFEGTELESTEQMTKWKYKNEFVVPSDDIMGQNFSPRYNSEQYYFLAALRRKYLISYEDASDYTDEIEQISNKAIIDNFEVLDIKEHQIINSKKQNKQAWNLEDSVDSEFFTNKKYEQLYKTLTSQL